MRASRPVIASSPFSFGKKAIGSAARPEGCAIGDEIRLFLTTFVAGFTFVLVLIA